MLSQQTKYSSFKTEHVETAKIRDIKLTLQPSRYIHVANFAITLPAYALEPGGARPSAGTVLTTKSGMSQSQLLQLSMISSKSIEVIDTWRNCNYKVWLIDQMPLFKMAEDRFKSQPPIHKRLTWKIWWNAHSNINKILAISRLFSVKKKWNFAQIKIWSLNPKLTFMTNNMCKDLTIFFFFSFFFNSHDNYHQCPRQKTAIYQWSVPVQCSHRCHAAHDQWHVSTELNYRLWQPKGRLYISKLYYHNILVPPASYTRSLNMLKETCLQLSAKLQYLQRVK